jgi:hypothetical protein
VLGIGQNGKRGSTNESVAIKNLAPAPNNYKKL